MATTSGGCRDLRKYMDDKKTQEIFGYLISGKRGYIPVQERRVEIIRCKGCGRQVNDEEKFCPECGTKSEKPAPAAATENADAPAGN
ncbi:MAG: zinc-ribbon domain-containing protein [Candidatus Pacearchaeota archaeon]|nr:zinc-ribbon domain-containing protein [Candidatus Pacearchaeota archaeon]